MYIATSSILTHYRRSWPSMLNLVKDMSTIKIERAMKIFKGSCEGEVEVEVEVSGADLCSSNFTFCSFTALKQGSQSWNIERNRDYTILSIMINHNKIYNIFILWFLFVKMTYNVYKIAMLYILLWKLTGLKCTRSSSNQFINRSKLPAT